MKIYRSFEDGRLLKNMDINGPNIIIRTYLDAFGTNNPIGSSSNKHKIMGFYYSPLADLKVAAKRSTIQTLSLIFQKDIDHFGLRKCLQNSMQELKNLVDEGFFDEKSKTRLQVRVISNLGDNLEQNEVAGIKQNFSTMQHSCRQCLCSRNDLRSAEAYSDIHGKNHEHRTDTMLHNDYLEHLEKEVIHINGVCNESLFKEFPYFTTTAQLPQCSSHDFMEGCSKLWLLIIIEHLYTARWFSWEALERLMKSFPYRGKDANSRYRYYLLGIANW